MTRTRRIIAATVSTIALSIGVLGMGVASPAHIDFTKGNNWCC